MKITKSISMDDKLWQEVKRAATEKGWSISFLIRELLKAWLAGSVKL